MGGRARKGFEHRSRFGEKQEVGGGLEGGRTGRVVLRGRWLLAMLSRTGWMELLARNHTKATLDLPMAAATAPPPRWPGWWRGTGR